MSRRRRHRPARIFLVLLIAVAVVCLLLRFVFVVRNVDVQGSTGALSHEDVVRAARAGFGESIFRVDENKIVSGINATGVLKAQDVQLRYPDTVQIHVSPRSKDAMVLHMGKIRVLDADGYVVESLDQVPNEDIVYVSGMRVQGFRVGEVIQAEEGQMAAFLQVIPAIRDQGASSFVSELDIKDIHNMRIITRGGITVELGDKENMHNKIAWMKSTVADLERRGEGGGTLDVSSGTKADYRYSG